MKLEPKQRAELEKVVRSNKTTIRQRTHARLLLASDTNQRQEPGTDGAHNDQEICRLARTSLSTLGRVRQRFVEEGLDAVLCHREQINRKPRVLGAEARSYLIATLCSTPPEGHRRWSLHLLKQALIQHGYVDYVSHETVRQALIKMNLCHG